MAFSLWKADGYSVSAQLGSIAIPCEECQQSWRYFGIESVALASGRSQSLGSSRALKDNPTRALAATGIQLAAFELF
jgi:hypothetical protein